jgi:hypothetical protein
MSTRGSLLFLAATLVSPLSGQVLTQPIDSVTNAAPTAAIRPLDLTFDTSKPYAEGSKSHLIDPLKEAEILKMMQLSGTEERMNQLKETILSGMRARHKGVPDVIWARVANDIDMKKMIDQEVAILDQNYTLDDLKALNEFYATPAGQHMLAALPRIAAESLRASREWEQRAAVKVMLELQDADLVMPGASNAAASSTNRNLSVVPPSAAPALPPAAPPAGRPVFPSASSPLFPSTDSRLFPTTNATVVPGGGPAPAVK